MPVAVFPFDESVTNTEKDDERIRSTSVPASVHGARGSRGASLQTLLVSDATQAQKHSDTATTDSDLISGVYEGGKKVWECSVDLLNHIDNLSDDSLRDKRVLELGCGRMLLITLYVFH